MLIDSDINFFDTVYIITDDEQLPRMATEMKVLPPGIIIYCVAYGSSFSWHYRGELSLSKDDTKIII